MPRQTPAELEEHLREQVRFIRSSAASYDAGDEAEAKRLAAAVRTLVWDSGGTRSVLTQLDLKRRMWFLDTSLDPPVHRPGTIAINVMDLGLAGVQLSADGVKYVPALDRGTPDRPGRRQGFHWWWNAPILKDREGNQFDRKTLVLALAHKDGGVHVDPKIGAAYAALSRSNSLGLFRGADHVATGPFGSDGRPVPGTPDPRDEPMSSPAPANVRQIAFELNRSLTEQAGDLLEGPSTARATAPTGG